MFDISGFKRYLLQISFFSDFFAISPKGDGKKAVSIALPRKNNIGLSGPMHGMVFTFSTRLTPPTCLMRLESPVFMSASHMACAYFEAMPHFNRTDVPMAAENSRELGPQLMKCLNPNFYKEASAATPSKCIYPPIPAPSEPIPSTAVSPKIGFTFDFSCHKSDKNIIQDNKISYETADRLAKLLDILLTLPTIISGPRKSIPDRRFSGHLAGTYEITKPMEVSYYGLAPAWLRSKHLSGVLFGQAFLAMSLMSATQAVTNILDTFPNDMLNAALNLLEEGAIAEARDRFLFVLRNIPREVAGDRSLVDPLSRLEWLWITKNSRGIMRKYLRPFSDSGLLPGRLGHVLPEDLKKDYEAFAKENPNP